MTPSGLEKKLAPSGLEKKSVYLSVLSFKNKLGENPHLQSLVWPFRVNSWQFMAQTWIIN